MGDPSVSVLRTESQVINYGQMHSVTRPIVGLATAAVNNLAAATREDGITKRRVIRVHIQ